MSSALEPSTDARACEVCGAPIPSGRLCEEHLAKMLGEAPTTGGGAR